ncbi:hypothetical protein RTBOTA2_006526 [Rhodotorula toruloides]|nr:hypothetical protein RTBOTA2_006526 [Rhodotorula toruloides]
MQRARSGGADAEQRGLLGARQLASSHFLVSFFRFWATNEHSSRVRHAH